MLTVTDKATQYLRESLTRKKEGTPEAFRIVATEEGYELTLDDRKDGDHVFEQDGQSYLLLDAKVSEALESATIDVQESPRGATLTLAAAGSPSPEPSPEQAPEPAAGPPPEPPSEPSPKP